VQSCLNGGGPAYLAGSLSTASDGRPVTLFSTLFDVIVIR